MIQSHHQTEYVSFYLLWASELGRALERGGYDEWEYLKIVVFCR